LFPPVARTPVLAYREKLLPLCCQTFKTVVIMDNEIKELLKTVLAQQVVLYKEIKSIKTSRCDTMEEYADELKREADNVKF